MKAELQRWMEHAKVVVVVGIGNPMRRDDYVGVKVVQDLTGKTPSNVMLIESDTIPESSIEAIIAFKPNRILLIDAGALGLKPGGVVFKESTTVLGPTGSAVSTHALPLKLFCDYLERLIQAKIGLLIVQPENTDFGEGLSEHVSKAAENLKTILLDILASPKETFLMELNEIQPSQLYINSKKLENVMENFASKPSLMEPIPIKKLGNRIVIVDGHTRALAALLHRFPKVPVYWEEEELYWEAYETCVRWCLDEGIYTIADLKNRVISHEEYNKLWYGRCAKMQRAPETKRKLRP
jgi:hydrogenase maturation protease HycI